MFRKTLLFIFLLFLGSSLNAQTFTKKATLKPILVQSGPQKMWCNVCGMNLKMFYKTSHAAKIEDGSMHQYCSIRCLVVDMKKHHINLDDVKVVDAKTQKLIKAKDAFYVVGSKVKGTMSKVSKIAFKNRSDANEFVKNFGGEIVTFNKALEIAKESLKDDIAMINMKKKKKMYPMGKKIFAKKCNNHSVNFSKYSAINELKVDLKKICKPLNEKQLQVTALYLWEVKRVHHNHLPDIKVSKDEKCPVCGMFVYKYPKWATQIFYADKHYSFDGVKDMMKYYFDHKENITKILVRDYYSQKTISAKDAYYVVGSNVYGPMGNELIAFESKRDATAFLMDHKGKKILPFNKITKKLVYSLDD